MEGMGDSEGSRLCCGEGDCEQLLFRYSQRGSTAHKHLQSMSSLLWCSIALGSRVSSIVSSTDRRKRFVATLFSSFDNN